MKLSILFLLIIAIICAIIFSQRDECSSYYPYIYESEDSILESSYILVNTTGCNTKDLDEALQYIVSEMPAMIFTTEGKFDRTFSFNEVMKVAPIHCNGGVKKYRSQPFKNRLALVGLDTLGIEKEIYINFYNGRYESLITATCHDYRNFNMMGAVVIIGEMGSSSSIPVYDLKSATYTFGDLNDSESYIYSTQLLAIIVQSLKNRDYARGLPLGVSISIIILICYALFAVIRWILSMKSKLIITYLVIKMIQLGIGVLLLSALVFVSIEWRYVCDIKGFLMCIALGGECLVWIAFYELKRKIDSLDPK